MRKKNERATLLEGRAAQKNKKIADGDWRGEAKHEKNKNGDNHQPKPCQKRPIPAKRRYSRACRSAAIVTTVRFEFMKLDI